MDVRGNRYLRSPRLAIGDRARDIIAGLWPPGDQSPTRLVYEYVLSDTVPEPLVIALKAGRVQQMLFTWLWIKGGS